MTDSENEGCCAHLIRSVFKTAAIALYISIGVFLVVKALRAFFVFS